MTDLEKEQLQHVYMIVEQFADIFENDVISKLQTLYLTDEFEDLHTALGMIGDLIDNMTYKHLLITKSETRQKLQAYYKQITYILKAHVNSKSTENKYQENEKQDLESLILTIQNCIYMMINFTYNDEKPVNEAINNIMELYETVSAISQRIVTKIDNDAKSIIYNDTDLKNKLTEIKNGLEILMPKPDENNAIKEE